MRNHASIPPPPPHPPMIPAPAQSAAPAASESADEAADLMDRLRFESPHADDDRDAAADPSLGVSAAPSSPSSRACAPQFHAPSDSDPLSPGDRAVTVEASPRSSRKSTRNNNPRADEEDTALATSTEAASSSSSSSQPACSCFAVQYTCALCKSSTATAVARSSSAPVPARCVKSAAAANGAHGAVVPSSTRTSQPTAHSPTAALTRNPSPAVSSVAAGVGSSVPSASPDGDGDDDDVLVIPTLNLAKLEEEVERKYHIDRIAEQRALQRNKEAVKAQQAQEDKERQQAQTHGKPPSSPHQYHHTHPLTARGKPIFKWDEIRTHASAESCWLVVRGTVYDVTPMLSTHPAGIQSILRNGGTEASSHFDFHSKAATKLWSKYEIGVLEGHTTPSCAIQ